jgi:predicted lipid carrier protein YhbT|tara:strand:+ start:412 stop:1284 length:873 start_codon:yes stop_codon:yes gene_type:complete
MRRTESADARSPALIQIPGVDSYQRLFADDMTSCGAHLTQENDFFRSPSDTSGMNPQSQDSPPLSPVLLAGIGLTALPPAALQPLLDAVMLVLGRRHAAMFTRLEELAGCTFRIDPTDLPFDFLLRPAPAPSLRAVAKVAVGETGGESETASIHGPLATLAALLEGKLDGDALFFSRDLTVAGDTEAVVTLRNIIDGAGIDIKEDVFWAAGPFGRPVKVAARGAEAVLTRMNKDIDLLKRALLGPVAGRQDRQAMELRELQEMMAELRRKQASGAAAGRRRSRKREAPEP